MTPMLIRAGVVTERVAWVRQMVARVRALPLSSEAIFSQDPRNAAAAESYLRRGIEALLDLGRHILAKGFAIAVGEYKEIGLQLAARGVLDPKNGALMRRIAGYRNRMVHFYSEVTVQELYLLAVKHVADIESLCDAIVQWLREHPEKIDQAM
jgi:uncharacterized protein YutE (UPF0331/DUF86 family)